MSFEVAPRQFPPGTFGDGSDGDVVVATGVTLTLDRNYFYRSLTVDAGGIIKTNSWQIFAQEEVINNGIIHADGDDGLQGASGATGGGGFSGSLGKGGNGGAGNSSSTPSDGSAGLTVSPTASPAQGGVGGKRYFTWRASGFASTSRSVTRGSPTAPASGDVLIAVVALRGGAGVTITAPSGFTLIRRMDHAGGSHCTAVYRKTSSGTEPTSWNWSFGSSVESHVFMICFRGVDTAAVIDAENGTASADGTSQTTPTITPSVNGTKLMAIFGRQSGHGANLNNVVDPSGFTRRVIYPGDLGTIPFIFAFEMTQATAAAVSATVSTAPASANGVAMILALTPLGGGPITIPESAGALNSGGSAFYTKDPPRTAVRAMMMTNSWDEGQRFEGGPGGGGGSGDSTHSGYGGAGGGGVVGIYSKRVTNNGRISANGGDAFQSQPAETGWDNHGMGGGGGGGVVVIVCEEFIGTDPEVNGGAAGPATTIANLHLGGPGTAGIVHMITP